MFGLPIEAISMILSTVMGGVMKMIGQSQQDKAEQWKMMMARNDQIEQGVQNARSNTDPFAAWTRRIIALTMVFGAFAFIFAGALLDQPTQVPVEVTSGFKFLLFDFTNTVTEYKELYGLVAMDWISVGIMNIIGFYFGSAAMQRK